MSSTKTLDYAEIRSQFLTNEILGLLAKKSFFNRKLQLRRLDIHSFSKAKLQYIRFKGIAHFPYHPEVVVRFDGTFLRSFLEENSRCCGERSDLLNGSIRLRIDGTDVIGSIERVLFTRPHPDEYWQVVDMQTPETNKRLDRRIGEALGLCVS